MAGNNMFDNINNISFNLNGSITDKKAIRYFVLLSPGSRRGSRVRVCNVFEPLGYNCMNDNNKTQFFIDLSHTS